MKRISLIAILLISIITSCSKFEDGPLVSLSSKTKRLTRSWIVEYKIDISTGEYYYKDFDGWSLTINPDNSFSKKILYNGKSYTETGFWKLEKDMLFFSYTPSKNTIEKQYKILRLTKKQLWIKDDTEEIHYKVY